jgi:hypothetical protein
VCSIETRKVFDATLPVGYANPLDVTAFAAALSVALQKRAASTTLLSPAYQLNTCALHYLELLLRDRGS